MDRTKAVQQAKSLVAQMTLEEKAGQLLSLIHISEPTRL